MNKKTLLLTCLASVSPPAMAQAEVQVTSPRIDRPAGGAIVLATDAPQKEQMMKGGKKRVERKVEQKGIKDQQKGFKEDQKGLKVDQQATGKRNS